MHNALQRPSQHPPPNFTPPCMGVQSPHPLRTPGERAPSTCASTRTHGRFPSSSRNLSPAFPGRGMDPAPSLAPSPAPPGGPGSALSRGNSPGRALRWKEPLGLALLEKYRPRAVPNWEMGGPRDRSLHPRTLKQRMQQPQCHQGWGQEQRGATPHRARCRRIPEVRRCPIHAPTCAWHPSCTPKPSSPPPTPDTPSPSAQGHSQHPAGCVPGAVQLPGDTRGCNYRPVRALLASRWPWPAPSAAGTGCWAGGGKVCGPDPAALGTPGDMVLGTRLAPSKPKQPKIPIPRAGGGSQDPQTSPCPPQRQLGAPHPGGLEQLGWGRGPTMHGPTAPPLIPPNPSKSRGQQRGGEDMGGV